MPEAVHLGDLLRIWVRPGARFTPSPPDFQGPARAHRTPPEPRRFPGHGPLSRGEPIPGRPALHKEKRTLPGAPASFSGIVCVTALDASRRLSPPLQIRGSEPDSLSIGRGRRRPSPHPSERHLHPRRLHPGPRPRLPCSPRRPSYSSRRSPRGSCCRRRPGMGPTLQRHPFSGLVDSAADSDFHGHRPAVYIDQHLFWGLMSVGIGRLNPAFGSSRSASSAYQKWPTRRLAFHARLQASEPGFLPI
ncbi:hypothetical protein Q8A73_024020 [Channa argus]|nr:hypothetical protein Q8A73_024020 [Channa argus]